MSGHWHFTALAVSVSALTVIFGHYWFVLLFLMWLIYLNVYRQLAIIPTLMACFALLFFLFYIPSVGTSSHTKSSPKHDNASVTGTIEHAINETGTHIQFVLQEEETSQQTTQISYFKNDTDSKTRIANDTNLHVGAKCIVEGNVDDVEEVTNPGEFDYRTYLAHQGIDKQMTVDSLQDISCKSVNSAGNRLLSHIYSFRLKLMSYVHSRLSDFSAAWISALVFGDDSFLDDEAIDLFQHWGLSHVLAISGLHVGLIASLLYFVLIKLNIVTRERAQMILMVFLPMYALLAGGEPSVWRASLMVLMVLLFSKLHIRMSLTDVISLVFIGLLVLDPFLIYHVGFQLSFLVTFGLLLSKKWFSQAKHPLFLLLQISFVSQIIIVPLQLSYFSVFQPLSIVLNVFVVPYFTLIAIPFMFMMLFASPIPILSDAFDALFNVFHEGFMSIVHAIDRFADFPFILGSFPLLIALLYYVFFFLMMKQMDQKKNGYAFLYGCLLVLVLVGLTLKPYLSPEGRVTMLDVGQGDSFVIELPYRKAVILYDAAAKVSFTDEEPTESTYQNVIKPYLYSRGIQAIDTIILSHEHIDHMGSVGYLLHDFPVKRIVTHPYYKNPDLIQTQWDNNPTPMYTFHKGEQFTIKDHDFFVLSPGYDKESPNENSLIVYTEFGNQKWMLTGDMEDQTEQDIMEDFPNLHVDIHQVGHHGSDTSTSQAFMDYLNPDYSLLSVGRQNMYGLPDESVLQHIANTDSKLLRTDEQGAITFRFQDEKGFFYPFLSK